jgi:hypothetical protein
VGDFDIVATFLFKAGPSKHGDLLGDDWKLVRNVGLGTLLWTDRT